MYVNSVVNLCQSYHLILSYHILLIGMFFFSYVSVFIWLNLSVDFLFPGFTKVITSASLMFVAVLLYSALLANYYGFWLFYRLTLLIMAVGIVILFLNERNSNNGRTDPVWRSITKSSNILNKYYLLTKNPNYALNWSDSMKFPFPKTKFYQFPWDLRSYAHLYIEPKVFLHPTLF
ncbi:hypothetical protein HELRODRAFT_160653 [Helobdella robusta]|uniref:Uncharacterized protein n=1 Tax=Helobdella robusta TaxID=6412 RepID=T1EQK1_HELRO|nr:hypothetical protein HELRODRAFT_160653 [Helobdella robusta]ESO06480.1 hypothetical protein HELRODRAFT_160653 [Helobdella robusta]